MKKLLVALVALIAFSANAQQNAAAIKLGFFTPKAAETGFIIGYEQGRHIDDNLDVAVSFDWYKKKFNDENVKAAVDVIPGLTGTDKEKLSETTINDFPIMVSITAKFPVAPKVKAYATGGFGGELLFATYQTYTGKIEEKTETAFDWNWRLGGGALYQLGQNSEIFGELVFHYSVPSYEYEQTVGTTTSTLTREYDMYGVLGRVGVRYYF